jgi:radical SAM protein with 4Fe4S-binding SPASM domain
MCARSWDPGYRRHDPARDMSVEVFRRVLDQVFPTIESVNFQGYGETVVSPHWTRMLDLCEAFVGKVGFELVTNLGRRDDALWRRMVGMGFRIICSVDGATAGTFEAIRVGGRFGNLLRNLEVLRRARAELGGQPPAFLVTLQQRNAAEMPLFPEFAVRCGVDRVVFSVLADRLRPTLPDLAARLRGLRGEAASGLLRRAAAALLRPSRPRTLSAVHPERLADWAAETVRRAKELGVAVEFTADVLSPHRTGPEPEPLERLEVDDGIRESGKVCVHKRCFKPYSHAVVNYCGEVGSCNHLISDACWEPMGSLMESAFEEIWNSPAFRRQRRMLARGRPQNANCQWCHAHRIGE